MKKNYFLLFIILFCFTCEFLRTKAQECGRGKSEVSSRIFGGEIAERAEWPWNVAFIHRQAEKFFCGGSLISAKHVLSAAHCFQYKGIGEPLQPNLVEALLGKFNLSMKDEIGSETLLVSEIVIHPDWKFDDVKFDADLSIVVLERKVTFSDFIQPICLPTQNDDAVKGAGTVVGWGNSETSGGSSEIVPSTLEMPAIDPAVCYTTHHNLGEYSSPRMFCGGFDNMSKAPCLGDSGGGFHFFNEGVWTIRGIVSGSLKTVEHGCDINKFALFTNVAKFTSWIEKVSGEKTAQIDWTFVEVNCQQDLSIRTTCSAPFEGPMNKNSKIRAVFSSHESNKSSIDVTELFMNFSPSTYVLSGIGEEFPNLKTLWVIGDSVKFIERQNFANLTRLDELEIYKTSVEFLPEDLLADLPNLTSFIILFCPQLERLPGKFFINQRNLKKLVLSYIGLTILQKDLLKNNLKLEELTLSSNKLVEIYVDFTRLPAVERIFLKGTKCFDRDYIQGIGSIQTFQDEINRKCQPLRGE